MLFVIATALFGTLAGSAILFTRTDGERRWWRLGRALMPFMSWSVLAGLVFRILETPNWTFNGTRLAPAFALTRGYNLYYPPDKGPVLETTYGPATALFYLSTTLMRTPNAAVLAGSAVTVRGQE
jgi:hypothetical protein